MQRDLNRRIRIIHPSVMILLVSFVLLSSFSGANAQPPGPEQYGLSSGFDPSMAIVVVVVVAAFFFIGMFSIFLRQCSEPAASGYYPSYAGAARYLRSRLSHGLDKSVIESFPVLDCSAIKEAKIGEGLECAVCLGEFEDDQSFRLLPKCRHVFHPDCIDTWLTSHVTCPVCRANLEEQDSSPSPSSGEAAPEPRADEITIPVGDFERLRPVRITGGKFPRSHSTGHSLAVINADRDAAGVDRYTLRLPEELMTEVIDRSRLERAASFNAAGAYVSREWSSTKGFKSNSTEEEGTGQGGRWVVFSMTPPFVSRGPVAVKLSTHKDVDGNGDGGSSVNSTNLLVSVKVPLNFLGGKVEGTGEPSAITARPLV